MTVVEDLPKMILGFYSPLETEPPTPTLVLHSTGRIGMKEQIRIILDIEAIIFTSR
jgi:hypothetical protein